MQSTIILASAIAILTGFTAGDSSHLITSQLASGSVVEVPIPSELAAASVEQVDRSVYHSEPASPGNSTIDACVCPGHERRDGQHYETCIDCFNNNIRQIPTLDNGNHVGGGTYNEASAGSRNHPTATSPTLVDGLGGTPSSPTPLATVQKMPIPRPGPFSYPNGTMTNRTAAPSGTLIMAFGGKMTNSSGPFIDITRANSAAEACFPSVMPAVAFWIAAVWALLSFEVNGNVA